MTEGQKNKLHRLNVYANKAGAAISSIVTVTETAGALWVGVFTQYGRRSAPIGTIEMPTSYLQEQVQKWIDEK